LYFALLNIRGGEDFRERIGMGWKTAFESENTFLLTSLPALKHLYSGREIQPLPPTSLLPGKVSAVVCYGAM